MIWIVSPILFSEMNYSTINFLFLIAVSVQQTKFILGNLETSEMYEII